jgi:hypothetical protein
MLVWCETGPERQTVGSVLKTGRLGNGRQEVPEHRIRERSDSASSNTEGRRTRKTRVQAPEVKFHSHAELERHVVSAWRASAEAMTLEIGCLCVRTRVLIPRLVFQTRAVQSSEPVRRRDPSCLSHANETQSEWPVRTIIGWRVTVFQRRVVVSLEIVTRRSPACIRGVTIARAVLHSNAECCKGSVDRGGEAEGPQRERPQKGRALCELTGSGMQQVHKCLCFLGA